MTGCWPAATCGCAREPSRRRPVRRLHRQRPSGKPPNPKAKRFYELSRRALGDNDLKSARTNLKLALSMEPDSKLLQDALAKLENR